MDLHHLTEAVGVLAFGIIFYSAAVRIFGERQRLLRALLSGAVFGLLALGLALSRILVGPGVYFDARNVPIALVTLFEGWPAGLVATLPVIAYRWHWLGGSGTVPGIVSVLAAAAVGQLVHWWALRHGRVRTVHAFALGGLTFLTTLLGYAMLGSEGLGKFARTWPHFLGAYVGGIGQGISVPLLKPIDDGGGWVAASFTPWKRWLFNVGYGIDRVDRGDLAPNPDPMKDPRASNVMFFGNVFYSLNERVQLALELMHMRTLYRSVAPGDDWREQFAMILKF
jgi:hypothetical protein